MNSKSESSGYKVQIGNNPSCECEDFSQNSGEELCKHIIWKMLNICRVPENSYLLQQLSLTDSGVLSSFVNGYPEHLLYKNTAPPGSRKAIVEDL